MTADGEISAGEAEAVIAWADAAAVRASDLLVTVVDSPLNADVRQRAFSCLRRVAPAFATRWARQALQRGLHDATGRDDWFATQVVEHLGEFGALDDVAPLLELLDHRRTDETTEVAVGESIARIQGRGRGAAGAVSVVAEGGGLGVVEV